MDRLLHHAKEHNTLHQQLGKIDNMPVETYITYTGSKYAVSIILMLLDLVDHVDGI